jgi:hypothetical protein
VAYVRPVAPNDGGIVIGPVSLVGGAVVIVSGSVLSGLASVSLTTAQDRTQFQRDAKAALDVANAETLAAAVLIPLGAAAAVAGGVLVVVGLE